jgi:hypothetical protein
MEPLMPTLDLTEKEASVIREILGGVLTAGAYDQDALKEDGYDAVTVSAIKRVLTKLQ